MRERGPGTVVVLPVVALVSLLVGYPLLRLGQVVWQEGGADLAGVLGSARLGEALRSTVLLAAAVTVTAVPLGTAMALVLRRRDLPGRAFLRVAVLLPLAVPDFVLGYSWTQAYARGGFTDSVLGLHWAGLLGPVGVWLVLVVDAAPLAYLVVAAGLAARAEPDLERAARSSGAGPATTLLTVTLRLLLPALAAAAVLVFVLTLASFAIPQVLGTPAGFRTVTTEIYADLSLGGDPASFLAAVTLALLLVLVTAVLIAPADALLGPRLRSARPANPQGTSAAGGRPAARRAETLGLAGYLLLTIGIPLAALVLSSITRAVGVPPTPDNWTLGHFRQVLTSRTVEALGRSLALAVAAASLLVVLGGLVAVLERRPSGRTAGTLITLTLVLPGSALAVGLLIAYGRWLSGTLALILLAYLAKLWAFGHRPIAGALDRLPPDELRAARVGGAGPLTAVRTVALRPLAPALAAAWLVCFLTALHEVTMSSLLYGPGSETLAVVVLNSEELGRIGPTAALSVLLTVLVVVPGVLLWRIGSVAARTRVAPAVEVPRAG
jgi:iron(III) transport system permease protein